MLTFLVITQWLKYEVDTIIILLYRWENWGKEKLRNLFKVGELRPET